MAHRITYRWQLRELMATRGMFTVTELMPHLAERGITLSASQIHRLVSGPSGFPFHCWPRSATSSTAHRPS